MANFNRRLEESNTNLAMAKHDLEQANDAEIQARVRAELNLEAARQAVERYLVNVTEDERLNNSSFTDLRQEFLVSAKPFFENLRDQEPGDSNVEASRANAYLLLAVIQQETGQCNDAQANYLQCIAAYETLFKNHSSDPKFRIGLSDSLHRFVKLLDQQGQYDDPEETRNVSKYSSGAIRELVIAARKFQLERFAGMSILYNAQLTSKQIREFCPLDTACMNLLKKDLREPSPTWTLLKTSSSTI